MEASTIIFMIAFAYLVGSIPSAIIVTRLMGLPDPRTLGSGNPGATNVLRTGSRVAAALTLLGDLLKGLVPVLIARALQLDLSIICTVAFAAFFGHLYPIFLGFKGGKGVATTLGVLLGVHYPLAVIWTTVWLLVAKLFKFSSLAALIATSLLLPTAWYLALPQPMLWLVGTIALFVIWRHRSNIAAL